MLESTVTYGAYLLGGLLLFIAVATMINRNKRPKKRRIRSTAYYFDKRQSPDEE